MASIEDLKDYIRTRLAEGFETDLFEAVLDNLSDLNNPLCLNNFAYSMRELTRHVLKRLAPDDQVLNCIWYENVTERTNGISRRQRMIYAVQRGLPDEYISNVLRLDTNETHKRLAESIDALSKYTHIEEETFDTDAGTTKQLTSEVLSNVVDLFELVDECREQLIFAMEQDVYPGIAEAVIEDTIQDIDELATHYSIEEIYIGSVKINNLDAYEISVTVDGSVGVGLQWGSDADVRRGDGVEHNTSFPFTCDMTADAAEPNKLSVERDTLDIDVSEWTGES